MEMAERHVYSTPPPLFEDGFSDTSTGGAINEATHFLWFLEKGILSHNSPKYLEILA